MAPLQALVLAGDRGEGDRLSIAANLPCRALLPLAGRAMIRGPLEALIDSKNIGDITISEPIRSEVLKEELSDLGSKISWMPSASSPSSSVMAALDRLSTPLLVTTADHAFLRPDIVDDFCERAKAQTADLFVAVVPHGRVQKQFPQVKKTALRLRQGSWCGCNLFYFANPDSRRAAELWRRAEKDRKRPWRIARALGWGLLVRFLFRRVSLRDALDHIGDKIGIRIQYLELPFPEASIDVDSIEDWKIVGQLIEEQTETESSRGIQSSKESPR